MHPTMKVLMPLVLAGSLTVNTGQVLAQDNSAAAMIDQGGGVLKQTTTGLEWAQADNGSDVTWSAAGKFCADKGPGWRLPSVAELLSLSDKSDKVGTSCGAGFTCKVSPLFRLTGPWAWTNEASNGMSSWIVILTTVSTYTYVASDATRKRALCVLKP